MEKRTAFITGATSGIGKATAVVLAKNGYNVIITGRRQEALNDLEKEITGKYNTKVLALPLDVRDKQAVKNTISSLPTEWERIDVLVNNAGLAVGLEHIQDGELDDWERMIDTNIKGILYVTRAIAPLMIDDGHGHIVNIGSIAGKEVYENGGVYCATKHAVDALTKSMRIDMVKHNIKVTQICPGLVETEFSLVRFKGDEERAKNPYKGLDPLTANDIAGVINYVLSLPPHVCINDLIVTPTAQAGSHYVNRK